MIVYSMHWNGEPSYFNLTESKGQYYASVSFRQLPRQIVQYYNIRVVLQASGWFDFRFELSSFVDLWLRFL
jgi:hypothetical protein